MVLNLESGQQSYQVFEAVKTIFETIKYTTKVFLIYVSTVQTQIFTLEERNMMKARYQGLSSLDQVYD